MKECSLLKSFFAVLPGTLKEIFYKVRTLLTGPPYRHSSEAFDGSQFNPETEICWNLTAELMDFLFCFSLWEQKLRSHTCNKAYCRCADHQSAQPGLGKLLGYLAPTFGFLQP